MTKLTFFFKLKYLLLEKEPAIILILVLALVLRFWQWPNSLVFDYEKVRDLLSSLSIYQDKKLTLIGPTTEVDGIYQGPLYYYIVGFFYFITGGDPRAASITSFGFNIASILIIYLIGKNLFGKKVGLIAGFIYAVSFESISYAYWLSNPGPSVPFIFLMFFFLYKFLTSKSLRSQWCLPLAVFCWGISVQLQILNLIFLPGLIFLYILSERPKPNVKLICASVIAFLTPISTFIVFDLKHNFFLIKNILNLAYHQGTDSSYLPPIPEILQYLSRLASETANIFTPTFPWFGIIILTLVVAVLVFQIWRKQGFVWKFLLIWIFSTLPIFFLPSRISQSSAAFIGISGALILTIAYLLNILSTAVSNLTVLTLVIILVLNFYAVNNYLTNPQTRLFDFFQGLFYKTDLELVDYTFQDSAGIPFRVDTVTSPLFISPLWDYLYDWRGRTKYHRFPSRTGKEQYGYLVIEPQLGASEIYKQLAISKANKEGRFVNSKTFGLVVIQKRLLFQK